MPYFGGLLHPVVVASVPDSNRRRDQLRRIGVVER
jgi:hypothetical protein